MVGKYGYILKVKVNSASTSSVLRFVETSVNKKSKFYIVTPNPEIVLLAQNDSKLLDSLNGSGISLPDGIGLVAALKYLSLPNDKTIFRPLVIFFQGLKVGVSVVFNQKWLFSDFKPLRGREIFLKLCELANGKSWKVFLLGGEKGVALKAKEKLERNYKKIKIKVSDGPYLGKDGKPISKSDLSIQSDVIKEINEFAPELLFVAFGAPKQEKWLKAWLPKLKINVAMVVGGAFDYLAGKTKLPPSWMEKQGLEWLWRLITQPRRIPRIFRAFPVFPLKIFFYKWKNS